MQEDITYEHVTQIDGLVSMLCYTCIFKCLICMTVPADCCKQSYWILQCQKGQFCKQKWSTLQNSAILYEFVQQFALKFALKRANSSAYFVIVTNSVMKHEILQISDKFCSNVAEFSRDWYELKWSCSFALGQATIPNQVKQHHIYY